MYETKQTGAFPPSFTVQVSGSDSRAVFFGTDAKERADEYAAFRNTPGPETER